ncbi:MAG: hypothetical protein NVS9B1_23890 [Candidatus Dormibacteraceae bacterium]
MLIHHPNPALLGVGLLAHLMLWAGVILLVIWAVRHFANRPIASPVPMAAQPFSGTARELLDHRLARSEISIDEYEQARAALEKP